MADQNKIKQAKAVYKALCEMLDGSNWKYDKQEDEYAITCSARGDDLPIFIQIRLDVERMLVILASPMPFEVPEDRRASMAVAVCRANNGMVDGNFDFSYLKGRIYFRLTSCYRECLIGKDLLEYMLMCSCYTIDEYNDKFEKVATTNMEVGEILDLIK